MSARARARILTVAAVVVAVGTVGAGTSSAAQIVQPSTVLTNFHCPDCLDPCVYYSDDKIACIPMHWPPV